MNWTKPAEPRRLGRPALLGVAAAATMLLGACSSATSVGSNGTGSNGVGSSSGAVQLQPVSGRVNLTPTWSTTTACPTGYQGSAVFRIIEPSGQTFSLSPATNTVAQPFHGTMLAPIGIIQNVANVPNGGTAELVVICFSGPSLTGTLQREMHTFITFSADGFNYTTSSTGPAGS